MRKTPLGQRIAQAFQLILDGRPAEADAVLRATAREGHRPTSREDVVQQALAALGPRMEGSVPHLHRALVGMYNAVVGFMPAAGSEGVAAATQVVRDVSAGLLDLRTAQRTCAGYLGAVGPGAADAIVTRDPALSRNLVRQVLL